MSASRLREAAELLRTRAEAAADWNMDDGNLWIVDYDPSDPSGQTAMQRPVGGADEPGASYIAMMSPPVALALADWLDDLIDRDSSGNDLHWPHPEDARHALDLADAILGDA